MRAPPTSNNLFAAVVAAAAGVLGRIWEARARRQVVRTLTSFDDHMLRDIGLTRFDLDAALVEPLLVDPTLTLAGRAGELRRHQRAPALDARAWATAAPEARAHQRAA